MPWWVRSRFLMRLQQFSDVPWRHSSVESPTLTQSPMTRSNIVLMSAKARVRSRLANRSAVEPMTLRYANAQAPDVTSILRELSAIFGVDERQLRGADKFRDILRVHRSELPENIQDLFPSLGLTDHVDVFVLDLLHLLENRVGKKTSRLSSPAFIPVPTNEDEWVERILEMTIEEFTVALA